MTDEVTKDVKLRSKFATNSLKVQGCVYQIMRISERILSHNHNITKIIKDQETGDSALLLTCESQQLQH